MLVCNWNQKLNPSVVYIFQRAGVKVKEIRLKKNAMHEQVKGKTMEGAKEMLTDGDLQSHRTLVFGLAKAFPKMNVRKGARQ